MSSTSNSVDSVNHFSPNQLTLLVLDDEVSVRRLLVRILSREGYTILEASTVDEAYAAARSVSRLDIFVTDAHVDGKDASREVERFRELHPAVAVVLVSGCEPELDRAEALEQLGVKFLAKPFSPVQLRQAIEIAIRNCFTNSTVMPVGFDATPAASDDVAVSRLRR